MMTYEEKIGAEWMEWQHKLLRRPGLYDQVTRKVQEKLNGYIPEKVHKGITAAVKSMVQLVLFGSRYTTSSNPPADLSLMHREALVRHKIESYRKTGAAEGGITGAGGFLMSLADFPILIGIKIKLVFEIASVYGYDVKDFKERLFILHIFQLAFSSKQGSHQVFSRMRNWDTQPMLLSTDADHFDWQRFQQEYRDYIDLAKMAQLIPGVGAAVGAVVNYRLLSKLGRTAMMAYRMRHFEKRGLLENVPR
ncbi:ABC transporter-associated protein EcsC [Pedobacter yulinensis]|uniref:ABC transporter-associated protein EcsC n=1 Tax=Pedobacter yulinensis TaxID=2126353 RepID=A0A2T3HIM1_9SPHI|nr:EcsC family protein [Pedobacter yulinensis]PST82294.1 ABC transporter-associated protein EcsC [Pedobacter yulinensis]